MKKYGLFAGLFVVVALLAWSFFFPTRDQVTDKRNPASSSAGYCIALRGNGEAEPAHWGALARTVEQLGMPSAMAGGSSAAVSMFLMEAIAANPMIQAQPIEVQKERASLLLKSMLGLVGEVQKTDTWNDFKKLYGLAQSLNEGDILKKALSQVDAKQFKAAQSSIERAVELGLLNPETLKPLLVALQKQEIKRSRFYINELITSVRSFGSFEANDDNLFFRAGIVSFDKAAETFGKVAGFYAMASKDTAQNQNWKAFFDTCQKGSIGLSWIEIVQKNPTCAGIFEKLFKTEFVDGPADTKYEEQRIGIQFPVYPTTAILTGAAVSEFRQAQLDYHRQMDAHFGAKFKVTDSDDVRFGYWGNPEDLQRIEEGLNMNDEKSRRFVSLGSTVWRQVLALSPAEPGLAPMREFTTESGKEFVSAGGWSDLHPVLVLKAAGCQNVLYINRRGGESIFAQGVAKRLFNFDREWALFDGKDVKVKELNDAGDPADQTSLWSHLYNLGNPHSSYNQSIGEAGAVLCTNWNDFPVQTKMMELIEDSYRASYWKNPNAKATFFSGLTPSHQEKRPGCAL